MSDTRHFHLQKNSITSCLKGPKTPIQTLKMKTLFILLFCSFTIADVSFFVRETREISSDKNKSREHVVKKDLLIKNRN